MTNARPLLDEHGRILKWYGTVVDMHDWRQAQEELRHTQEKLAYMMRVITMGGTDRVDRPRSQPAAVGHRDQRRRVLADAGR